jgi:hypothetical protein
LQVSPNVETTATAGPAAMPPSTPLAGSRGVALGITSPPKPLSRK